MTQEKDHPPIPSIQIKTILARRDNLTKGLTGFLGHRLSGATFHAFVDRLHQALPDNILRNTVHQSLIELLKQELTPQLLLDTCWRLAGNMEKLLDQQPVISWGIQRNYEWIPVQICDVYTTKKYKQLVHSLTFQSLAGTVVPLKLFQHWSIKKTTYLATFRNDKGLGFGFGRSHINSRGEQKGNSLFYDIRQFYGLRCFLLIDPKQSKTEPIAVEVGHSSATMVYNRNLISGRDRLQNKCIRGLPDTVECFHCPYGTDKCALATHEFSFKKGKCPRCTKDGFFDPAEIELPGLCINCVREERIK